MSRDKWRIYWDTGLNLENIFFSFHWVFECIWKKEHWLTLFSVPWTPLCLQTYLRASSCFWGETGHKHQMQFMVDKFRTAPSAFLEQDLPIIISQSYVATRTLSVRCTLHSVATATAVIASGCAWVLSVVSLSFSSGVEQEKLSRACLVLRSVVGFWWVLYRISTCMKAEWEKKDEPNRKFTSPCSADKLWACWTDTLSLEWSLQVFRNTKSVLMFVFWHRARQNVCVCVREVSFNLQALASSSAL